MSHQSLYRKYRPQNFDEVIGQEHVVKALKGAIENDSVSHAYIFSGSRGTGKTSLARIFSKVLGTDDDDIYEIDAASYNGVDQMRELNEAVFTLPFRSKYKIYILDEVHMLSKQAWNSFLKTLEEPPAHVIFIMATTEIEKIPETILSRCQTFIFRKPTREILKQVIDKAVKAEKVEMEEGVAELIAIFGDGAFRDAYGTLEKLIGWVGGGEIVEDDHQTKKITLKEAEEILGAPDETVITSYISGLTEADFQKCVKAVKMLSEKGVDMTKAFEIILERYRELLIAGNNENNKIKVDSVSLIILLDHYARMKSCPIPEMLLEAGAYAVINKDDDDKTK